MAHSANHFLMYLAANGTKPLHLNAWQINGMQRLNLKISFNEDSGYDRVLSVALYPVPIASVHLREVSGLGLWKVLSLAFYLQSVLGARLREFDRELAYLPIVLQREVPDCRLRVQAHQDTIFVHLAFYFVKRLYPMRRTGSIPKGVVGTLRFTGVAI